VVGGLKKEILMSSELMTIEEIWKQNGINTIFYNPSSPQINWTIVGRWREGILYIINDEYTNPNHKCRLCFNDRDIFFRIQGIS